MSGRAAPRRVPAPRARRPRDANSTIYQSRRVRHTQPPHQLHKQTTVLQGAGKYQRISLVLVGGHDRW